MDVQCEHCKTEYEFDDALVSGRGTTVRCTNCGHQFKVRPAGPTESASDKWLVQTASGQRLTFLTLRELQRAILAKQVGRADVLMRGGGSPRPLGSITELEPFFEGRTSSRPPPARGGSVAARVPTPPTAPPAGELPAFPKRTAAWGTTPVPPPPAPAPRRKVDTLRPTDAGAPPPSPPPRPQPPVQAPPVVNATPYAFGQAATASPVSEDPLTLRRQPPAPAPPPPVFEAPAALPPPTNPVRTASAALEEEASLRRSWNPSSTDEVYSIPGRRRVGGWIVAAVLLVAVGVVGWVVVKPYLAHPAAAATVPLDPRAQGFVAEGEKAMTDGNLELAQEDFDKASALAEHDARVLLDEARVSAAKADVPWLKLLLLPADATDEQRSTKAQLADRIPRIRKAADEALAASPEDPAAIRAKIDALRLVGERDAARSYVAKILAQTSQPETAYVLAALDLGEAEPLWPTMIDRLRLAAAGEGNAGRARAALVYALAKSGDKAAAKSELASLDALARPYPLLSNLHAFVDKAPAKAAAAGSAVANIPHIALSALPSQPAAPAGGGGHGETAVPEGHGAMQAATQAIKKGDWNRAREIYEALATRNPSDSEALAGLGDVARAQGDTAGAVASYKRALAVNPSYLPALLGVADTEWAGGDHASAQRSYKDIEDRFPEGTYPGYVKTRAEPGGQAAPPPPTPPTPPTPAATASAAPTEAPTKPAASTGADGL